MIVSANGKRENEPRSGSRLRTSNLSWTRGYNTGAASKQHAANTQIENNRQIHSFYNIRVADPKSTSDQIATHFATIFGTSFLLNRLQSLDASYLQRVRERDMNNETESTDDETIDTQKSVRPFLLSGNNLLEESSLVTKPIGSDRKIFETFAYLLKNLVPTQSEIISINRNNSENLVARNSIENKNNVNSTDFVPLIETQLLPDEMLFEVLRSGSLSLNIFVYNVILTFLCITL